MNKNTYYLLITFNIMTHYSTQNNYYVQPYYLVYLIHLNEYLSQSYYLRVFSSHNGYRAYWNEAYNIYQVRNQGVQSPSSSHRSN